MQFLRIDNRWSNANDLDLEVVERKGLGHPDTGADGIADAISIDFSRYCLENFDIVLHHNVDKVYVGGGHFTVDFGSVKMLKPVQVLVNGRMSNTMNGESIDIESIQKKAVENYLGHVLPHFSVSNHFHITANATQHTQRNYWYTPRKIDDVPDAVNPQANDTSLCVAHYPFSVCEQLTYALEQFFWERTPEGLKFKYPSVGQDIKVMSIRKGQHIDVTICLPIISRHVASRENYEKEVLKFQELLRQHAEDIIADTPFKVSLFVNSGKGDTLRQYMLGYGSCLECGEEGVVGRGNSTRGFISANRAHSMEAPFGKNPVYHSGRVQGFLTQHLAKAIHKELGISCSIFSLTKAEQSLVPPYTLIVQTEANIDRDALESVVDEHYLQVDYLTEILKRPAVLRQW